MHFSRLFFSRSSPFDAIGKPEVLNHFCNTDARPRRGWRRRVLFLQLLLDDDLERELLLRRVPSSAGA